MSDVINVFIEKKLGHGSIQVTADTYLDVTEQYESGQIAKVSSHLNSNVAQMWHEDIQIS